MSGYKTNGRWFNLIVRKLGYLKRSLGGKIEVRYIGKEHKYDAPSIDIRLREPYTSEEFYTFVSDCKACGFVRVQNTDRVIFGQTAQAINRLKDNHPWQFNADPPRYADAYGYNRVFAPLPIF